jgi:enterochelin esterase-like enzyme
MRFLALLWIGLLLSPAASAGPGKCVVPTSLDPARVTAHEERATGLADPLCVLVAQPLSGASAELTLIVLHGLGAGPKEWFTAGGILDRVDALTSEGILPPTAVVAPEGRSGYWTDWSDGKHPWGAWVRDDLMNAVEKRYHLPAVPERVILAGVSMGGFGALSLGLRRPDRFGILVGLSPTDMELATAAQPKRRTYTNVFGRPLDKERVRALSPKRLVEGGAGKGQLVLLAWGATEPKKFSHGARLLRAALEKAGVASESREVKGGGHGFSTTWGPETQRWFLSAIGRRLASRPNALP